MADLDTENTSGSSRNQNESTLRPPGPPETLTYPPPNLVAAARSVLGPFSSSHASVDQIRSSTQSRARELRPRPSQAFAARPGISSSPYRSDSAASPIGSDIYNASDGVGSPYKSGRIRNRRQRPTITPRTFDDILPPIDLSTAAEVRDNQVESEYWDSETDGDLEEIPEAMIGGWNAGEEARFIDGADAEAARTLNDDDNGENEKTHIVGGEDEESENDIQMEEAPLDDGGDVGEDTFVQDDYIGNLFSDDEDDKEGIYSDDEDLPPCKR